MSYFCNSGNFYCINRGNSYLTEHDTFFDNSGYYLTPQQLVDEQVKLFDNEHAARQYLEKYVVAKIRTNSGYSPHFVDTELSLFQATSIQRITINLTGNGSAFSVQPPQEENVRLVLKALWPEYLYNQVIEYLDKNEHYIFIIDSHVRTIDFDNFNDCIVFNGFNSPVCFGPVIIAIAEDSETMVYLKLITKDDEILFFSSMNSYELDKQRNLIPQIN